MATKIKIRKDGYYPKTYGDTCLHEGSNLFSLALGIIQTRKDAVYVDDRLETLIARLPSLWQRCRSNEGY